MKNYELRAQLEEKIKLAKEKLQYLNAEKDKNNALQLAFKLVINGFYGAMAARHFVCFCNDVAGSVTAHGREMLEYMMACNEEYWYEHWHLDTKVHDLLGVTNVTPISRDTIVTSYGDTDSVFVTYKPGMVSCEWDKNPLEFIHIVSKHAVTPFFSKKLDEYAKKYGVENIQDFEMEQISKSIIFLDKKMYVKNVVWEDGSPLDSNPEWGKNGVYMEPESSIQAKGIDLVRSSTPVFARERVKDIIKYFFKNPETYNDRELVKMIRELKEQFKLAKIEDISHSSSCSNYNRGVVNDETAIEVQNGTHFAVKAAAFHNYLLNQNPEYKLRYNLIKSGQKIKYYATKSSLNDKFAYTPGAYPFQLASKYAEIDYDTQFEKCILSIVNRFNKVLGLSELNAKLTFTLSLF